MSCIVVSRSLIQAQLLSGLLAQCCPVVIDEACDCVEVALAAINRHLPELLILDRDAADGGCERLARRLSAVRPDAKLILLCSDPRTEPLRQQLANVLPCSATWQALIRSVRAIGPDAAQPQRDEPAVLLDPLPDADRFEALRPRERSVLRWIGSGLSSREIARILGVSLQTVETYRKSLGAKLGVSGARLVRIAVLYSCLSLGLPFTPGPPSGHLSAALPDHGKIVALKKAQKPSPLGRDQPRAPLL